MKLRKKKINHKIPNDIFVSFRVMLSYVLHLQHGFAIQIAFLK
jgi:hypothetical protein